MDSYSSDNNEENTFIKGNSSMEENSSMESSSIEVINSKGEVELINMFGPISESCPASKSCQYYLNKDAKNRHANGKLYTKSYEEVASNKNRNQKWLKALDDEEILLALLDFGGYVIAGGIFTTKESYYTDMDIFIYQDHNNVLKKLINVLKPLCFRKTNHPPEHAIALRGGNPNTSDSDSDSDNTTSNDSVSDEDEMEGYEFSMTRTKYLIEFIPRNGPPKIQIILRKYTSIAEILYGFDIGPSQIAYDGKQFYFTVMSKLAFDTGIMIADTTRRSTTYEKRLRKYQKRGFDLILPYGARPKKNLTTYDKCVHSQYVYIDKNNKAIPIEQPTRIYAEYSDLPANTLTDLTNILYCLNLSNTFCISSMEFDEIEKENIINKINVSVLIRLGLIEFKFSKIKAYTKPLLEELTEKVKLALETKDFGITWIEKNPGTQSITDRMISPVNRLTASINPIFEDPSEWYGDYYYPIWSPNTIKYRPDIPYQTLVICFPNWPLDIINLICFYLDDHHKAHKPLRYVVSRTRI